MAGCGMLAAEAFFLGWVVGKACAVGRMPQTDKESVFPPSSSSTPLASSSSPAHHALDLDIVDRDSPLQFKRRRQMRGLQDSEFHILRFFPRLFLSRLHLLFSVAL